jgi:hypothetical protein
MRKIFQITIKFTKLPQNIPNGRKIDQLVITYTYIPTSSIAVLSQIYPHWDFWFQNMPSGNPVPNCG